MSDGCRSSAGFVRTIPKGTPESGQGLIPLREDASHTPGEIAAARAAEAAEQRVGAADGRYSAVPLSWGRELGRLARLALAAAPRVTCPVLILHGEKDRTADPEGSLQLARVLGGEVRVRFFAQSPHLLTLGPERGTVAAEVARFIATKRDSSE